MTGNQGPVTRGPLQLFKKERFCNSNSIKIINIKHYTEVNRNAEPHPFLQKTFFITILIILLYVIEINEMMFNLDDQ